MATNNIMQEIRSLLSEGKSASEVIALGFKPPTVYKVQRQLRKQGRTEVSDLTTGPALTTKATTVETPVEVTESQQRIASLEAELAEAQALRSQLDQAQARITELEAAAKDTAALAENLDMAQEEARSWQRTVAEAQHALTDAQRQLAEARGVIQKLQPLKVWAGHPCCVCREATDGALDRESAAKLLDRVGHRKCLEQAGLRKAHVTFASLSPASRRATALADQPRGVFITY